MRPVATPNSRGGSVLARSARKATVGSTTAGSNSSGQKRLVSLSYLLIKVGLRQGESMNRVELALAYIEC
jgi:hypothetical protein